MTVAPSACWAAARFIPASVVEAKATRRSRPISSFRNVGFDGVAVAGEVEEPLRRAQRGLRRISWGGGADAPGRVAGHPEDLAARVLEAAGEELVGALAQGSTSHR